MPRGTDALPEGLDSAGLLAFRSRVLELGRRLYRDLPWRRTRDPYAVWVSEVMLQQTQVARVDGRWQRWLERFPTPGALAQAPAVEVLREWQGMGYNRRALALQRAAQRIAELGSFPQDQGQLVALPGIGPATAAGIRAFAFDAPGVYLETNVRAVFLHELFAGEEGVPDKRLMPLVQATCPLDANNPQDDPRTWYYALLDYGAWLKRTVPNPSRRSRGHARQSKFEGSHRQKRAELVRILLAAGEEGLAPAEVAARLNEAEAAAGRAPVDPALVKGILAELSAEGFCRCQAGRWLV